MKKVLMLAVLFVGSLVIAQGQQQLEPCLLCNATGQKTMPKHFPCQGCRATGIMPCLGCNGVGEPL